MLLRDIIFFCVLIKLNLGQNVANNCRSKETCSECIQESKCLWCINPVSEIHCVHETEVTSNWCENKFIINPKWSYEVIQNNSLSSVEGSAVQVSPQRVKLTLRKEEEFNLQFQYAQARNYPVDLYYIMDLSASMEDHREKLAILGDKLARTMMNITNNFKIGFGSFVDKVDLPFVSTVPEKLKKPCKLSKSGGQTIVCVSPYSFKNHMSLTTDYKKFSREVFQAKVSGNIDVPEGGFDALMQAIVCKNVIGWRAQARHLVVFSTDAEFHVAGDGKLAGVVEPNDALCHMENNKYTHDLILDYPSVSQINYIAKENNINIVFAIVNKKRVVDSYKKLSQVIENSNMGALDERSENVIKLVTDNYKKIVDSVTISSNVSTDVEVKIASTCANFTANGCPNIHVGEIVNFTATIKPLECTKGSNKQTISIKPEGLDESIIVDLEVLCDCGCETNSDFFIPNSDKCSSNGTLKCGVCDCNVGYFGKKCECNRETSQSLDVTNCKQNENDTTVCSGLGICRCGQCQCNKRANLEEKIFGKFCDCDNYSCKRVNGKLCSHRGTCECGGICNCHAGWTGDACQCPDSSTSCMKPDGNNLICNNHGNCNCGKCECFNEKVRYSGRYCDECPTCEGQRCEELRHCVECQAYNSGIYNKNDCVKNCTTFKTNIVEKIDNRQDEYVKICTLVDDNDCTFTFQYEYLDIKDVTVTAEKKKVCRGPPNILAWVLGVIGSILLAGLIILLIWKLCTTVHDRREFAKFENERKNLKWHRNDNPLYIEATSTFANLMYRRSGIFSRNT